MKICLILSAGRDFRAAAERGKPYASYAPTTIIHLAALIPAGLEAEVRLVDLGIDPLPENIEADLIGISTITCGANEAYRIADYYRRKGTAVVLGGYHPSALPEEALKHADAVVVGYAENTWPQLLRDFQAGSLQRIYQETVIPSENIVLPKLDRQLLGKGKYRFTNCLETTRGCPNHCDFCVISRINPHCVLRDMKNLVTEIEMLGQWLLFLDSNHTEFPAFNRRLWQELKRREKKWLCGGSMRFLADRERLKYAAECGLKGILVGFESINQDSLAGIHKGFNSVKDYKEIIKRVHDLGIGILANFIFGLDNDDESVFERTVAFAQETRLDIVRYAVLAPLPGTPVFTKLKNEGRLLTENWDYYDTDHVVFQPKQMSPERLFDGLRWAYKETYTWPAILKRLNWSGSSTIYSLIGNIGFRQMARADLSRYEDILE
jgi:radical SAM superfamily enzyme YgiQ (UPF0313 family)